MKYPNSYSSSALCTNNTFPTCQFKNLLCWDMSCLTRNRPMSAGRDYFGGHVLWTGQFPVFVSFLSIESGPHEWLIAWDRETFKTHIPNIRHINGPCDSNFVERKDCRQYASRKRDRPWESQQSDVIVVLALSVVAGVDNGILDGDPLYCSSGTNIQIFLEIVCECFRGSVVC